MPWVAKNALGGLFLPPCNLLLLQLAGLVMWRWKPRLAFAMITASAVGLYICSVPATAVLMVEAVEWQTPQLDLEKPDLARQADAIVVLGAGRSIGAQDYNRKDKASPHSIMRLRYAADIWRKTHKPVLITGGSPGNEGQSEAELMGEALQEEFGVKPTWLESRAENTAQNAEFSFSILSAQKIKRIFLVTQAWHMPRAQRAFKSAGFTVVTAPTAFLSDEGGPGTILGWIPCSKGLEMSYLAMHEGIGAIWYRLRGVD